MAVSTNERRQVAARLREHAKTARRFGYACVLKNCTREEECEGFGIEGCEGCFNKSLTSLADLIEPEPERTCRNVSKSSYSDEFDCSECGLNLDLCGSECGCGSTMAFFDGRKVTRTLEKPNYCPNCGARVKEGE